MTLALTLGMSVGYRRTLWMMIGELAGVALVSISAVLGIAAVMLNYPWLFTFLKFGGGAYLALFRYRNVAISGQTRDQFGELNFTT